MSPSRGTHVAVVGAGIVGASIAYHLVRRGARVTLLERERPAAAASGSSFGWINASFGHPDGYHRLRQLAMLEYLRLERELPEISVSWSGSLSWLPGAAGDALARLVHTQQRRGYPVRLVESAEFAALEPAVRPVPACAAYAEREASVEADRVTRVLLQAAESCGAEVRHPCAATDLIFEAGRLRAVATPDGAVAADVAVLAAGTGTLRLAQQAKLHVPLMESVGLLVRTKPLPLLAARVLLTPDVYVRQRRDGPIVIGLARELDPAMALTAERGDDALASARDILPDLAHADAESVTLGHRPMPADRLPIVGFAGPGRSVYLAVMHSGVTLAPLVGRLAAAEILDGVDSDWLAPYRLSRFGLAH